MRSFATAFATSVWLLCSGTAHAGQEEVDLQRQIEAQRAAVADLERLDAQHTANEPITHLRSWLDEAFSMHSEHKWERVREVLERCVAQAEMIRQKIEANQYSAKAAVREAALKRSQDKLERTKVALQQTLIQKKAMEMTAK